MPPKLIGGRTVPGGAGTLYRGKSGQWAFLLHRTTGMAVFLFLLLHVIGISAIGFSDEAYNQVEDLYHSVFFRMVDAGLIFAVCYHAANGLRIVVMDFWARSLRWHREMTAAMWVVTAALTLPALYFNFRPLWEN